MMLQIGKNIMPQILRGSLALGIALTLAACTSQRFGSSQRGNNNYQQSYSQPEPVEAIPSGGISSEPLAPLAGTEMAPGTDIAAPTGMDAGMGTNSAALTTTPPAATQTPTRMSVVGGWTAKDATGSSCRIVLSSASTLDLYKASTSGCNNKDLAKISAWDYRDGEVYLYQTGGTMTARLRAQSGNMSGALTKSGAPLNMSR